MEEEDELEGLEPKESSIKINIEPGEDADRKDPEPVPAEDEPVPLGGEEDDDDDDFYGDYDRDPEREGNEGEEFNAGSRPSSPVSVPEDSPPESPRRNSEFGPEEAFEESAISIIEIFDDTETTGLFSDRSSADSGDRRKSSDGMGGLFSFYDPILFKVDEYLGEDGYAGDQGQEPDTGLDSGIIGPEDEDDYSMLRAFQTRSSEYPGEYDGEDEGEPGPPPKPPRVDSELQFQEMYMKEVPEEDWLRQRLSIEAMGLQSRKPSPSPPATPRKTYPRMHECPSVESFLKLGDPVHVQFMVLPGQKLFSIHARVDRNIFQVKKDISPICKVPPEYLDLRKNRNLVMDYKTLKELGAKPRKKLKFTVELSKRCPPEYTLRIPEDAVIVQLPTLTKKLMIPTNKGWKTVKLTIEFSSEAKPFLGGYREKKCGVIYHHAITQTPFYSEPYSDNVRHFSCQTFDNTWKVMQTTKDQYQQTARPDYYLCETKERVIWAKEYLNSDYIERKRVKAAIIIQKYWRRWLAIRERAERLEGLIRRIEWAENIRKGRTESRLAIKEDELWRQHHPSRMVDVELLYRAINEWRRKEVAFVEAHRWGADRKAALAEIMEMEADLLLNLERTKTAIRKNLHGLYIESAFHKMGDPTRWLNRSGNFVSLDNMTKFTVRQYHKLYHSLQEPVTNIELRYSLLDKLYQYIKNYSSMLSQYLVTLIGREVTLMKSSAGTRLLIGLRQRIVNTFYHLLRDPHFNPEARKLQKVPFDSMKLRKDMIQCKGCRQMQYRDQFTVIRGVTVTTRCVTCMGLYRTCILRADLNLYRRMLLELRHDEQSAGVDSSVTYLIDAYDVQFLIEQLWHGQSALSGIDDRYLLRLCRWKQNLPWTPWNCVLLTEEESVAHLHLENMKRAYQPSFFHKVHVKHQGARIYFARLTSLAIPLDPALDALCTAAAKKKKKAAAKKKAKSRFV